MAGEYHGSASIIAGTADRVDIVWNGAISVGDRLHQWSNDGGSSWSETRPIVLALKGGFSGPPALAVDSANTLHLVTGLDGNPGQHGEMYYLSWDGTEWDGEVLISQGAIGKKAVESPSATVSEGNRLRVVYSDDTERIWYTTRTTGADSIAPQPFSERAIGRRPEWWVQLALTALAVLLIASRVTRGLVRKWRAAQ
jgi:hypothetical protein